MMHIGQFSDFYRNFLFYGGVDRRNCDCKDHNLKLGVDPEFVEAIAQGAKTDTQ